MVRFAGAVGPTCQRVDGVDGRRVGRGRDDEWDAWLNERVFVAVLLRDVVGVWAVACCTPLVVVAVGRVKAFARLRIAPLDAILTSLFVIRSRG